MSDATTNQTSKDTKGQNTLSPRAAQELVKLRAPPPPPGAGFWITITLILALIIGMNFDPPIHALGALIAFIGLSNFVLILSLALGGLLIRFVVFEKLRRGVYGSVRTLWAGFGISRVSGTSLKLEVHHDGANELAMLSGKKDASLRSLRNQAAILILIAVLSAAFFVFAVVYGHGLSLFRPLVLLLALTGVFVWIAVWVLVNAKRQYHGPTEEDIKGAVALHCECEEERRKELRELHKRGN